MELMRPKLYCGDIYEDDVDNVANTTTARKKIREKGKISKETMQKENNGGDNRVVAGCRRRDRGWRGDGRSGIRQWSGVGG